MSRGGLSHHPAPKADQLSSRQAAFLLYTGPLAWFAAMSAGYMMTSWPCFPHADRLVRPAPPYGWTGTASVVLLLLAAALAAVSGLTAWRKLRAVDDEHESDRQALVEVGHGRTRFVALWGAILGWTFAGTALLMLIAFAMLPRCLG